MSHVDGVRYFGRLKERVGTFMEFMRRMIKKVGKVMKR